MLTTTRAMFDPEADEVDGRTDPGVLFDFYRELKGIAQA
jgi:hypothetical protein